MKNYIATIYYSIEDDAEEFVEVPFRATSYETASHFAGGLREAADAVLSLVEEV